MQKMLSIIYSERIHIGLLLIIILFNILTFDQRQDVIPKADEATITKLEDISIADLTDTLTQRRWLFSGFLFFTLAVLVSFIIGIFLLAKFILLRFFRKIQTFPLLNKIPVCPWSIKDAVHVLIFILFFTYCAGFLLAVVNLVIKKDLFLLQISMLDIVAFVVILYFIKRIYKKDLSAVGLNIKNILPSSYWAILSYITFIPLFFVILLFNTRLMDLINYEPLLPPVLGFVLEQKNPFALLFFIVQVGVIAPFVEELFFRGFLYNALKKRLGLSFAVIITTLFFALSHQELLHFIPIVSIGLLLVYVYERSGSLWTAVVVHSIHNLSTTYFVFLIKGLLS